MMLDFGILTGDGSYFIYEAISGEMKNPNA